MLGVAPSTPVANEAYRQSIVKGWAHFNGTVVDSGIDLTGVAKSFNVAGVHDNGTGDYFVYWETEMADANYAAFTSQGTGATDNGSKIINTITTHAIIQTYDSAGTLKDMGRIYISAIGDQ